MLENDKNSLHEDIEQTIYMKEQITNQIKFMAKFLNQFLIEMATRLTIFIEEFCPLTINYVIDCLVIIINSNSSR